jgi:hypothetical protein
LISAATLVGGGVLLAVAGRASAAEISDGSAMQIPDAPQTPALPSISQQIRDKYAGSVTDYQLRSEEDKANAPEAQRQMEARAKAFLLAVLPTKSHQALIEAWFKGLVPKGSPQYQKFVLLASNTAAFYTDRVAHGHNLGDAAITNNLKSLQEYAQYLAATGAMG